MLSNNQYAVIAGSFIGIPYHFLLEVAGAAGAVWGPSEAFNLRHEHNETAWKSASIGVFAISSMIFIAKFINEEASADRRAPEIKSAFWHAVTSPHEAIKDEFFAAEPEESSPYHSGTAVLNERV